MTKPAYSPLKLHYCNSLIGFVLTIFILYTNCGHEKRPVEEPFIVCSDAGAGTSRSNASRFGIFAPEMYQGYAACVDSLTRMLGARPGYFFWFQAIGDPFPAEVVAENTARSASTVISMDISSTAADSVRNDTLLKEIILGMWDSTLETFAVAAAQSATVMYLRFGYEMNGNWFPWGEKSEWFAAAWNHAHAIFSRAGATNVRWIFAPGIIWDGRTVGNDIMPYYPGDSVVDAIGLDGYNFGDGYDQWHHWQSFRGIYEASFLGVKDIGKPLWITEIGCPADPRRSAWLGDLFAFMDENPCVEALLWFNAHKAGEPDFRLQSDSASLNAMRKWLAK